MKQLEGDGLERSRIEGVSVERESLRHNSRFAFPNPSSPSQHGALAGSPSTAFTGAFLVPPHCQHLGALTNQSTQLMRNPP